MISNRFKLVREESEVETPQAPLNLYEYYAKRYTLEALNELIDKIKISFDDLVSKFPSIDKSTCPIVGKDVAILADNHDGSGYLSALPEKTIYIYDTKTPEFASECCTLDKFLQLCQTQYEALEKSKETPANITEPATEMYKLKRRLYNKTLESYTMTDKAIKVMASLSDKERTALQDAMPNFNTNRLCYRNIVTNENAIPIAAVEVTTDNLRVYVSPSYRGKGIGTHLLKEAVDASIAYNHGLELHLNTGSFVGFAGKISNVTETAGFNDSTSYTVACESFDIAKKIFNLVGLRAPIRVCCASKKMNDKAPIFKKSVNAFYQLFLDNCNEVINIGAMKKFMQKEIILQEFEYEGKADVNTIIDSSKAKYQSERTDTLINCLKDYGIDPDEFYNNYKRLHAFYLAYSGAKKIIPNLLHNSRYSTVANSVFMGKYFDKFEDAIDAVLRCYMLLADQYIVDDAAICDFIIKNYVDCATASTVPERYRAPKTPEYFQKELFLKATELALKLETTIRCPYVHFSVFYTTEYDKASNSEIPVTVRIVAKGKGKNNHGTDNMIPYDEYGLIYNIIGEVMDMNTVVTEDTDMVDKARYVAKTVVDKSKYAIDRVRRVADATLTPLSNELRKMVDGWGKSDHDDEREQVITGSTYLKLRSMFKSALGPALILFSGHFVFGVIAAVVQSVRYAKDTNAAKHMAVNELELELKITDEKIDDARSDGDKAAKYKLMRIKNKLEHEISRLKYGQHPDE